MFHQITLKSVYEVLCISVYIEEATCDTVNHVYALEPLMYAINIKVTQHAA